MRRRAITEGMLYDLREIRAEISATINSLAVLSSAMETASTKQMIDRLQAWADAISDLKELGRITIQVKSLENNNG